MRFELLLLLITSVILISCTPATVDFSESQLNNLKYNFSSSQNPQTALVLHAGESSAIHFKTSDTILSPLEIKMQYEILSSEKFEISSALVGVKNTNTIPTGSSSFTIDLKASDQLPFSGTAEIKMTLVSSDGSLEISPSEYKIKILNQSVLNPSIAFNTFPTYVNNVNKFAFLLTGTCTDLTQFKLVISSVNYAVPCTASTWTQLVDFSTLDEGSLTIEAKDLSAITTYQTTTIIKDTVAPVISSISDSSIHASTSTTPIISWLSSESGSGFQFYEIALGSTNALQDIYSWTNIGNVTSKQITGLTLTNASTYYIQLRATDNAGNVSIAYAGDGFTVNTTAPVAVITNPPPTYTNNSSFSITIAGSNITDYSYKYGPSASTFCSDSTGYSASTSVATSLSITGTNNNGTLYRLCVIGKNTALIWQSYADATETTWNFDNSPPVLTINLPTPGDNANSFNYTNFVVTASCSESGRNVDFYVESTVNSTKQVNASANCTLGSVSKSLDLSILPEGGFFVRVTQEDQAGNVSNSPNITYNKDTIAPVFSNTEITMSAYGNSLTSTPSFNWTAATDTGGSGLYYYKLAIGTSAGDTSVLNWTNIGSTTSHTANSLALSDGQTYYVSLKAYDNANNFSSFISQSWMVDATNPLVSITNPANGAYITQSNQSSFNFTVNCEVGLSTTLEVTSQVSASFTQTISPICTTSTMTQVFDLSTYPEGSVLFKVSQVDNAGNMGTYQRTILKDTIAPSFTGTVADNLYYPLLSQSPTISWSAASDTNGILRYEIALGDSPGGSINIMGWTNIGVITSLQITSLSLTNNTTYYPSVRAIDNAGNISNVLIGDGWLTDNIPPLSPTGLVDGDQWAQANQTPMFSWSTSTDIGSGVSHYKIRVLQGVTEILPWTQIASTFYSFSAPPLIPGTIYHIEVKTVDWAGNESSIATGDGWLQVDPGWKIESLIKAANADAGDFFGNSTAMDGDTLVVGAYSEDSNQTTITNGTTASSNNSLLNSGAVYVYRRVWYQALKKYEWAQEAYIKASNADADDQFGKSVAISGDTLVVGALGEQSNQTTITNGSTSSSDNSLTNSGAAYVFKRSAGSWTQEAYLKASNADGSDNYGYGIAIHNDTIVVSAPYEASSETTIYNNSSSSSDDSKSGTGAVYVYIKSSGSWIQQAYIKASNADQNDWFGYSVAISNDTIVVGAPSEDSSQNFITNGLVSGSDPSSLNYGAAYVFKRSGASWTQEAYLKASNADQNDQFGFSVSIHLDTIVVGAPYEDSSQNFITNGLVPGSDYGALNYGAAYVFKRSGASWTQEAYLKASNADSNDWFGYSVAVHNDTILVGAPSEDNSSSSVLNGDMNGNDSSSSNYGAAYVFKRSGASWTSMAYLKSVNPDINDTFGRMVCLNGNTATVSSYNEAGSINFIQNQTSGFTTNNTAPNAGAVYVYKFD